MGDYWRLLRQNRFQIHPSRYPMTGLVGVCSVVNSSLGLLQRITHGRKIRETVLAEPPVFIIGHWRSGTTLMHELISLDQRFNFPSNFDAFIPSHSLVSRLFFYPLVQLLMPGRRPMDNMAMGAGSPQEDDFALISYGAPTPYRRIAFPNRPSKDHLDLNLSSASPATTRKLREALETFLKSLTVRYRSRLVLKSPPHTGRIKQLAEWFPGAKFVHLSRHPYKMVPSTMRLWRLLDELQGFQVPNYDDTWLKNYIFECKDLMYSAYLEDRAGLKSNQLVEVRFEDLVEDPDAEMKRVYEVLELGKYRDVRGRIEDYFRQKQNHQKNKLNLDPALQTDIAANWQQYMSEFRYQEPQIRHHTAHSPGPPPALGPSSNEGPDNFIHGQAVVDAND